MSAPLAHDDTLYRRMAAAARLSCPSIHTKVILIVAFRINPVNGRAFVPDAVGQRRADTPIERSDLGRAERASTPERVKPSTPEGFIGIDIADAGDKSLV